LVFFTYGEIVQELKYPAIDCPDDGKGIRDDGQEEAWWQQSDAQRK